MESLYRLKKAIDFIIKANPALTNEAITESLGYTALNYLSDILGGSKRINHLFLNKLHVEYSINPQWVLTGEGSMILTPPPKKKSSEGLALDGLKKYTLQDYINKVEEHNAFLQKIVESNLNSISKDAKENTAAILSEVRGYGQQQIRMMVQYNEDEFAKAKQEADKIYLLNLKMLLADNKEDGRK